MLTFMQLNCCNRDFDPKANDYAQVTLPNEEQLETFFSKVNPDDIQDIKNTLIEGDLRVYTIKGTDFDKWLATTFTSIIQAIITQHDNDDYRIDFIPSQIEDFFTILQTLNYHPDDPIWATVYNTSMQLYGDDLETNEIRTWNMGLNYEFSPFHTPMVIL